MKTSIGLMLMSVLFFIVGSIYQIMGHDGIFGSPLSVVVLGLVGVATCWCTLRQRQGMNVRYLGFILCHLGVVVILIGAGLAYGYSDRVFFSLPIQEQVFYGQLPREDQTMVELPFGILVSGLQVERYPPNYGLYRLDQQQDDYIYVQEVKRQFDDTYDMGELGKISSQALKNFQYEDGYIDTHTVDKEHILYKLPATDKHYVADMIIVDESGTKRHEKLLVNKPVSYKGWRFYLMSYDRQFGQYVVLSGRYDPGRYLVIGGIWLTIVGTAILCLWQVRRKEEVA